VLRTPLLAMLKDTRLREPVAELSDVGVAPLSLALWRNNTNNSLMV